MTNSCRTPLINSPHTLPACLSAADHNFPGTGTSSGVPMIACTVCPVCRSEDPKDNRLRSSILVESETCTLAVDAGPDFRYQMLRAKVRNLEGILFTHPHKDHMAGLDDVRAFNYFQNRPMKVYANELTQTALKKSSHMYLQKISIPGYPISPCMISPQIAF